MTLQEVQLQALQLPLSERWQLVQTLLKSLKRETLPQQKRGKLSRLRGIAKSLTAASNFGSKEDYITYLLEKY